MAVPASEGLRVILKVPGSKQKQIIFNKFSSFQILFWQVISFSRTWIIIHQICFSYVTKNIKIITRKSQKFSKLFSLDYVRRGFKFFIRINTIKWFSTLRKRLSSLFCVWASEGGLAVKRFSVAPHHVTHLFQCLLGTSLLMVRRHELSLISDRSLITEPRKNTF